MSTTTNDETDFLDVTTGFDLGRLGRHRRQAVITIEMLLLGALAFLTVESVFYVRGLTDSYGIPWWAIAIGCGFPFGALLRLWRERERISEALRRAHEAAAAGRLRHRKGESQ